MFSFTNKFKGELLKSVWYLRLNFFIWLLVIIHYIECKNKTYGKNCQENCEHCANDSTCHHVDGRYLHGCQAGYKQQFCKLRM